MLLNQIDQLILNRTNLLQAVIDAMKEGVVIQNTDGAIVAANPASCEMLGLTEDQLYGRTSIDPRWHSIHEDGTDFPGEDHPAMVTLRTSIPQQDVIMGVHKPDGTLTWIKVNARLLHESNTNSLDGVVVVFTDITEIKMLEERRFQLRLQQERTQILSSFIRSASHEFRTPLSVITSCAQMLAKQTDPIKKMHNLAVVDQEIDHITQLLDKMLLMAELDSMTALDTESVSLSRLLNTLQTHYYCSRERMIEMQLGSDCLEVNGHGRYLDMALRMILENAIQHTATADTISISVRTNDDTYYELVIEDTGQGMTPEQRDNAFSRFYRGDKAQTERGFGLGLPIAQRIVQLHKGEIDLHSTSQQGTIVTIRLPRPVHKAAGTKPRP